MRRTARCAAGPSRASSGCSPNQQLARLYMEPVVDIMERVASMYTLSSMLDTCIVSYTCIVPPFQVHATPSLDAVPRLRAGVHQRTRRDAAVRTNSYRPLSSRRRARWRRPPARWGFAAHAFFTTTALVYRPGHALRDAGGGERAYHQWRCSRWVDSGRPRLSSRGFQGW